MQESIIKNLQNYLSLFPEEKNNFDILQKQIEENQNIIDRSNYEGHVTASALIINHKKEVLVVWHNKLQKYLQPGGHIESVDETIVDAATREMKEETGIISAALDTWCMENNAPIIIDTHAIPENIKKGESPHYHHDFMFIYRVDSDIVIIQEEEVSGFLWVSIDKLLEEDFLVSKALRRMRGLGFV